jgi:hypothetical protein
MSIKSYFKRAPKLPDKPAYDLDEVLESWEHRKETTFENHCKDVYYWFYRFLKHFSPSYMSGYIKRAYQRCTRGWSDRDLWSLDYTIAKFALPRLKELKKIKHGTPTLFFPPDKYSYTDEEYDVAKAEWDKVLDEIIFAMDYIANCREWDYYPKKTWPEKPAAEDYTELHEVEKRVQEGLILFGKHFRALWD